MARRSIISHSLADTDQLASELALHATLGSMICLFGDLGVGKTAFSKAFIHALTGICKNTISSPTFTYCNTYNSVHHFDLYRLKQADQFFALGFDELMNDQSICIIEWPERIKDHLPKTAWMVEFEMLDTKTRKISYETPSFSTR